MGQDVNNNFCVKFQGLSEGPGLAANPLTELAFILVVLLRWYNQENLDKTIAARRRLNGGPRGT